MSEENLEHLRRLFEAYNARDIDAILAHCDPSVEYHSTFAAAVGGDVYHGHEGLRRWHRDLEETWGGEIRAEPEAFFDLGERTLAFLVMRGRGRKSGVDVAMPAAMVNTWRDGLAVLLKVYADRDNALSDLGVSPNELKAIAP
jgi:ketosteroid isomerase-like protein